MLGFSLNEKGKHRPKRQRVSFFSEWATFGRHIVFLFTRYYHSLSSI